MVYALDSDIISYLIKNNKDVEEKFKNMKDNKNLYCIPPLTYYEVKRWLVLRNATIKLPAFTKLYQDSVKTEMTLEIWEKAIEIYVELITNGTPRQDADIFIAAFCIVNDYTLITNNTRHYDIIKDLKIENWKS